MREGCRLRIGEALAGWLAGMVFELGVQMFVTQRLWIPPSEVGRVPGSC
jgi:hypothetical protein